MTILAGDVGGTKTHLAIFKEGKMERNEKFVSQDHPSLLEIAKKFVKEKVDGACFGVAGPVKEGKCKATNLPWVIDSKDLKEELKTESVCLLNDLEANAWGIQTLEEEEFFIINEGEAQKGNQALISAGTGLGEAGIYWDGKSHHPFSSEGGHADFAPRDEMEMELLHYLQRLYKHVSYERVLSGSGLYLLYRFLTDMRLENPTDSITQEFSLKDPALVITENALNGDDEACVRALNWFISLYAAEAGNLALKFYATGGIFIGGGIAPKILDAINPEHFMKSFTAKGRFEKLLSAIPVKVILNDNAALQGAAFYATKWSAR